MFNHSARGIDNSVSVERRNIAIAEIVLWSIIHLLQIPLRYKQEWRYWHHWKNRNPGRCLFYSWWSMTGILAQRKWNITFQANDKTISQCIIAVRIASSSMVLATRHPNKSMLIAESAMQSAGLSPLLFEISLLLLAWYVSISSRHFLSRNYKMQSNADTLAVDVVDKRVNLDPATRDTPRQCVSRCMVFAFQSLLPSFLPLWEVSSKSML